MEKPHSVRIPFLGLGCASDAPGLERRLARVAGTRRVYVNPVTETIHAEVDGPEVEDRLRARLEEAGYRSYVSSQPRGSPGRQNS